MTIIVAITGRGERYNGGRGGDVINSMHPHNIGLERTIESRYILIRRSDITTLSFMSCRPGLVARWAILAVR